MIVREIDNRNEDLALRPSRCGSSFEQITERGVDCILATHVAIRFILPDGRSRYLHGREK